MGVTGYEDRKREADREGWDENLSSCHHCGKPLNVHSLSWICLDLQKSQTSSFGQKDKMEGTKYRHSNGTEVAQILKMFSCKQKPEKIVQNLSERFSSSCLFLSLKDQQ